MVARISIGSSLYGALAYNGKKINEGKGKLLVTNKIFDNGTGKMDIHRAVEDFKCYMPVQMRTEKPVIHISLNPHPDDKLTDVELATIALYNMKFNDKIKALRKAAHMNQQELADKLHIHVTHLSKMENGHLLPSIDIVQRLMKVFAVIADNLLNDSEDSVVELQNHELNEH